MHVPSRWRFLDLLPLRRVVSPTCVRSLHSSSGLGHTAGDGLSLDGQPCALPTPPLGPAGSQHALLLPEDQPLAGFPRGRTPGGGTDRRQEPVFFGLWGTPPRTAERQEPLGSAQAPSLQRSGLLSLCGPEEVSESQTLKKTDSETPRQERGEAQGMSSGRRLGESRGCLQHARMSVSNQFDTMVYQMSRIPKPRGFLLRDTAPGPQNTGDKVYKGQTQPPAQTAPSLCQVPQRSSHLLLKTALQVDTFSWARGGRAPRGRYPEPDACQLQ